MFTGLVEETGKIGNVIRKNDILSISIYCENVLSGLKIGESVSVSGICLTVVKIDADSFWVELTLETIKRSTAKNWVCGSIVNLERALSFSDRLGGHLVQGHIDGVSVVKSIQVLGDSWDVEFSLDNYFSMCFAIWCHEIVIKTRMNPSLKIFPSPLCIHIWCPSYS